MVVEQQDSFGNFFKIKYRIYMRDEISKRIWNNACYENLSLEKVLLLELKQDLVSFVRCISRSVSFIIRVKATFYNINIIYTNASNKEAAYGSFNINYMKLVRHLPESKFYLPTFAYHCIHHNECWARKSMASCPNFQSGFIPGSSTVDQMSTILDCF